jgi:hypothetical protein
MRAMPLGYLPIPDAADYATVPLTADYAFLLLQLSSFNADSTHPHKKARETLLQSLYVGGDTDSIAALTMSTVGGRYGLRLGESDG